MQRELRKKCCTCFQKYRLILLETHWKLINELVSTHFFIQWYLVYCKKYCSCKPIQSHKNSVQTWQPIRASFPYNPNYLILLRNPFGSKPTPLNKSLKIPAAPKTSLQKSLLMANREIKNILSANPRSV